MKGLILPLAAAGALAAASAAVATQTNAPQAPAKAQAPAPMPTPLAAVPDGVFNRELKDLDGRSFFLSNFRGQVFVINIWATWCGPCRLEIPELNRLYEEYSPRGVGFVGLTTEDPQADAEKVREFAGQFKMRYSVAWADHETARVLMDGRSIIPQTIVVAPDGRIHTRLVGYAPDKTPGKMREAIGRALGDEP